MKDTYMHAFNSSKNVKKAKQYKDNTSREIMANNYGSCNSSSLSAIFSFQQ